MPVRTQVVTLDNMGGGQNDFLSPNAIDSTEMPNTSRNMILDGNDRAPRKGYVSIVNTIGGASGTDFAVRILAPLQGGGVIPDSLLIFDDSSSLHYLIPSTGVVSGIAGTVPTERDVMNWAQYKNYFFIFNGYEKMSVVDTDTGACSIPSGKPDSIASASDFKPSCGAVYQNSLHVGGVPIAPNTLFISKPASTGTPTAIYDFSGAIIAYGDAQEILLDAKIVSITALPSMIVIFTVTGAYFYTSFTEGATVNVPDVQKIPNATGAVSQRACCVTDDDVLYLSPDLTIRSIKRQIANTNGDNYVLSDQISLKLNNFLRKNCSSDQTRAFSYYDSREKVAYFYLKPLDSGQTTIRIVFDYKNKDRQGNPAAFIHTNLGFSAGCFYKGVCYTASAYTSGGGATASIYQDNIGTADEGDSPIYTRWDTKDVDLGRRDTMKNFYGVHLYGEIAEGTEMTVGVYVDDVLVKTQLVTGSGTYADAETPIAGIAALPVGLGIGEEGVVLGNSVNPNLREFDERLNFKAKGRKIRVTGYTNNADSDYRISSLQIIYSPRSKALHTQADAT